MLTFVTDFLNYYRTPLDQNTIRIRLERLQFIVDTSIQLIIFTDKECEPHLLHLLDSKHIVIVPVDSVFLDTFSGKNLSLPKNRFPPKDTMDYMIYSHMKVKWLNVAVQLNPFDTFQFAWIDSNIVHMIPSHKQKQCQNYLTILSLHSFHLVLMYPPEEHSPSKICLPHNHLFMPGCSKGEDINNFHNNVLWRFCGSFFLGSKSAIEYLNELYDQHFSTFLETTQTMVWDVNFWAWLEKNTNWKPIWYSANHNESIFKIPVFAYVQKLPLLVTYKYKYPEIENFRPSSASYLEWDEVDAIDKEKKRKIQILNTRYVNYEYLPSGHCTIHDPENKVKTKNMFCFMQPCYPKSFYEVSEVPFKMGIRNNPDSFFQGLEDIRLYRYKDAVRFIATTVGYSPSGKNRMVRGSYAYQTYEIRNVEILEPPTDTPREKNWIPFIGEEKEQEKEYFIYSWTPMFQMGQIVERDNKKILEIVIQKEFTFWNGQQLRGSSNFIWTPLGYVGVVHFSIDGTLPKQYYHSLIWLDKKTYLPTHFSNTFCFLEVGIEFCTSIFVENKEIIFWISQQDRNPLEFRVLLHTFDRHPI